MSGTEIALAASALSAVGAIQQGRTANQEAKFAAQIAEQNATRARQEAAVKEAEERRKGRAREAAQRVRIAGSGAGFAGTPVDILGQSAGDTEYSALNARYGGDVLAAQNLADAAAKRLRGKNAQRASYFKAGSTLLNGIGTYQSKNTAKLAAQRNAALEFKDKQTRFDDEALGGLLI